VDTVDRNGGYVEKKEFFKKDVFLSTDYAPYLAYLTTGLCPSLGNLSTTYAQVIHKRDVGGGLRRSDFVLRV
jgi:hypothetical protein